VLLPDDRIWVEGVAEPKSYAHSVEFCTKTAAVVGNQRTKSIFAICYTNDREFNQMKIFKADVKISK
jgi:hypothetical protein